MTIWQRILKLATCMRRVCGQKWTFIQENRFLLFYLLLNWSE